jgi:hypothetical protein
LAQQPDFFVEFFACVNINTVFLSVVLLGVGAVPGSTFVQFNIFSGGNAPAAKKQQRF